MSVRFGIAASARGVTPDAVATMRDVVRMGEELGVERMGGADSQWAYFDSHVSVTLLAQMSQRAQIGLAYTNPVTREPSIMASFVAGIDALCDGRSFLVMGSGDTAVYNAGLKPGTRATIEEYVACVRDLLATGHATYKGREQVVSWAPPETRARVPIYILAEGPRMLRLGGRIGDGVILGNGVLPEVVEGSLRLIEEGARESGRRLEDLDVWWSLRPALSESHAEAMEMAKATVSSAGNHSMRFGIEGKHVPPELVEPIKEYTKAYTSRQHLFLGGPNVQAMERAGLTEYFLDRFAVAGDPAAWVERLKELEERGVNKIWFAGMGGRKELRLLGEEIMPAL